MHDAKFKPDITGKRFHHSCSYLELQSWATRKYNERKIINKNNSFQGFFSPPIFAI